MPAQIKFEKSFPNTGDALIAATTEAMDFVTRHGATDEAIYAVNLVIEEMATNILKYGYDDSGAHTIRLQIQFIEASIEIVLEDDGHEYNPLLAQTPDIHQDIEDREPGGLGIHLVKEFAQDLSYERRGNLNRLRVLVKK